MHLHVEKDYSPHRNAKLVTRPWLGSNNLPSLLPPWNKVVTIGCKVVTRLQQPYLNHLGTISNPGFVHGLCKVGYKVGIFI